MTALVVIEAVAIALLALLVAGLLRSYTEILRSNAEILRALDAQRARRDEPSAPPAPSLSETAPTTAATAPDIAGSTPDGEAIVIPVGGGPRPTLVAFLSSRCITCHHFWEHSAALALPEHPRVVIVTMGAEAESESAIAGLAPPDIPVVMSSAAWDAYSVPGAPYFVLLEAGSGRIVGKGTASDWTGVGTLITRAMSTDPVSARRDG